MVHFQLESGPIATFLPPSGRQMDRRRRLKERGKEETPGSRREEGARGCGMQGAGRQGWEVIVLQQGEPLRLSKRGFWAVLP